MNHVSKSKGREKVQGQTSNSTDSGEVSHGGASSRSEGADVSDPGAYRIRLMNRCWSRLNETH